MDKLCTKNSTLDNKSEEQSSEDDLSMEDLNDWMMELFEKEQVE